ncbi:branched-chain amino acid transaminase [Gammaproteobacteria bacterium]|nr:branched-chain amino acid transaminase [Gammaproteobacteria bacterium]
MFNNTESKSIWNNGKFVKWNDSLVHLMSHTLNYGTGAFEGVRAYKTNNGPAIFRLNDHTDRLFNTAKKIDIDIPFSKETLNNVQKEIFKKNDLDEGYIRPIVYLGAESLGIRALDLSVNVAVAAWEWPSYMDPKAKENGISVIKSSHQQYSNPLHSGNKIIGTYINSTMALHEALKKGADEAVLMDKDGFISEGSGENIFMLKGNKIFTPTTNHCLNGITRQSVITIASDEGFEVIEKNLTYEDLANSDEAFFTGTAVEITPITSLDMKSIGSGKRGNVTEKLQTIYSDAISGKSDKYSSWLTYANPLARD